VGRMTLGLGRPFVIFRNPGHPTPTSLLFVIFYRIEQQHHHPEKYINVVAFVEEEEKKGESRGGAQILRVRVV